MAGEHRAPEPGEDPERGPVPSAAPPTERIPIPALPPDYYRYGIDAVQAPVDTGQPDETAAPELPEDAPRPEPVLDAARVAGVISAVILAVGGLLRVIGLLALSDAELRELADQASQAVLAVAGAWALFGPWIMARLRARDRVTPLSDPRDGQGRRLIPEER